MSGLKITHLSHDCRDGVPDVTMLPTGSRVRWRCPVCGARWTGAGGPSSRWNGGGSGRRWRRQEARRLLSDLDAARAGLHQKPGNEEQERS